MPRSLGFGLSKHHEACHGVWPNQPISAPPGTCSWPSKAQPVLDPACPWLPVRSWPAPRLLSRGLSPLRRQVRHHLAPKRGGPMPTGAGSPWRRPGLPPAARSPAPRQEEGERTGPCLPPGTPELRPEATTWGTGAAGQPEPAPGAAPRAALRRPHTGPRGTPDLVSPPTPICTPPTSPSDERRALARPRCPRPQPGHPSAELPHSPIAAPLAQTWRRPQRQLQRQLRQTIWRICRTAA